MNTGLMAKSLEFALMEVGTREDPPNSNKGPRIEQYQNGADVKPGNAYCAAFVYFCVDLAAHALHLPNPLIKTGWSPSLFATLKKAGQCVSPAGPIPPGSLFFLYGNVNGLQRVKHVGFVKEAEGTILRTVEGNTDKSQSREGDGVYETTRNISTIFALCTYG